MDKKLEFKSIDELYNRVLPALRSKVKELKSLGYKFITEEDVWNYLVMNEWKKRNDLLLHELVNDILYLEPYVINEYVMKRLERIKNKNKNIVKDTAIL